MQSSVELYPNNLGELPVIDFFIYQLLYLRFILKLEQLIFLAQKDRYNSDVEQYLFIESEHQNCFNLISEYIDNFSLQGFRLKCLQYL